MTAKALPEQYRRASNIREGYEIHTTDAGWLPVASALRIYAPANIVAFTFDDGTRFTTHPGDEVMSRRPAVVLPAPESPVEHDPVGEPPSS